MVFTFRNLLVFASLVMLGVLVTSTVAQAKYVKINNALTIYYEESGHGSTPIVFVPGLAMSTEVFDKQLARFKNSDKYRFITYDPRSQGHSSDTFYGNNYHQHGGDLHAFLKALDLHNVVLAGWSFGGLDVLSYIQQFGADNLKGLVLIDSPPRSSGKSNKKQWVWYDYNDADHFERFFTLGPMLKPKATYRGFAKWMLEHPTKKDIAWIVKIARETPAPIMALLNAGGAWLDYSSDLKALNDKLPLLYVVRAEEKDLAKAWAHKNTPKAKVVAFGKHMMFWQHHKRFNDVLTHFLRSLK